MGAPESFLLKVYIREMISMQPPVLICGIVSAEAIYYILSGIFGGGQRYIGLPQIIVSVFVHIAVISLSVALTYFKMIKRSVVYEIRGKESNQALAVLTKKNRFCWCSVQYYLLSLSVQALWVRMAVMFSHMGILVN